MPVQLAIASRFRSTEQNRPKGMIEHRDIFITYTLYITYFQAFKNCIFFFYYSASEQSNVQKWQQSHQWTPLAACDRSKRSTGTNHKRSSGWSSYDENLYNPDEKLYNADDNLYYPGDRERHRIRSFCSGIDASYLSKKLTMY